MSNAEVIAEMLDSARKFNLYYLQNVDPAAIMHRPVVDGREVNSAYWIAGHLLWAQVTGTAVAAGGALPEIPWVAEFSIGKKYEDMVTKPTFKEIMDALAEAHAGTLAQIRSLSDEQLQAPCRVELMNWNTTVQKALYHFIRHESFHTGQIALIAKSRGAKLP